MQQNLKGTVTSYKGGA